MKFTKFLQFIFAPFLALMTLVTMSGVAMAANQDPSMVILSADTSVEGEELTIRTYATVDGIPQRVCGGAVPVPRGRGLQRGRQGSHAGAEQRPRGRDRPADLLLNARPGENRCHPGGDEAQSRRFRRRGGRVV